MDTTLPKHYKLQVQGSTSYATKYLYCCIHLSKQLDDMNSQTIDSTTMQATQTPTPDQILDIYPEEEDIKDTHAVAVTLEGQIVGHCLHYGMVA